MTFRTLLRTWWKSLFPGKYKDLVQQQAKQVTKDFFVLTTWGLLVFSILLVPGVVLLAEELAAGFGQAERFTIEMDVDQQAPIMLLSSPAVILDTRPGAPYEGAVLVTNETIHLPTGTLDLDSLKDFSSNQRQSQTFLLVLLLALIPALAVLGYIYTVGKAVVLALIAGILLSMLFRAFRYQLSFANAWKVSLLATLPMLTLEWLILPFYRLFWIPIAVFLVYALLGAWLTSQKEFAISTHKKAKHKF